MVLQPRMLLLGQPGHPWIYEMMPTGGAPEPAWKCIDWTEKSGSLAMYVFWTSGKFIIAVGPCGINDARGLQQAQTDELMEVKYGCSENDALETGVHHWERYHDRDLELELVRAPAATLVMLQTTVLPISSNKMRPRFADLYSLEAGGSRQVPATPDLG